MRIGNISFPFHGVTAGRSSAICTQWTAPLTLSKGAANPYEWIQRPDVAEKIDPERWKTLLRRLADLNRLNVASFEDFVRWCFDNPRTVEQAKADRRPSVVIWFESLREEWRKAFEKYFYKFVA